MELKDWVAVYGAVLSTLVAAWNVYLYFTDKGKLKVKCYLADIVGDGEVVKSNVLTYSVTNVGKKPIYVSTIGGKYKDSAGGKYFLINMRRIPPIKLEPGEYFSDYTHDLSVLTDNLESLHAIDTIGRVYNANKREVQKLIEQVKKSKWHSLEA